ncbi:MAG: adenylate kinase family protein [Patescibacteria group bacterium]
MKVLLIGPQGSGKGTIGKLLSEKTGLPHISVGALLREAAETNKQIRDTLNNGDLVSYETTAGLIKSHIEKNNLGSNYILDGWVRNLGQLEVFNPNFDKVIYLTLSENDSVRRLSGRRICSSCGWMCNIYTMPPKSEGSCDLCGSKLLQREDDTEEAVKHRLEIFYTDTMQVVDRFRDEGILVEVDASPLPKEVMENLLNEVVLNEN